MSDARDTLRALATVDRCFAVWCAAQCARRVLHLLPEGEERPRRAIEAAEAWAREPTRERKDEAYEAWVKGAVAGAHRGHPAPWAGAYVAHAVGDATATGMSGTVSCSIKALTDAGASGMDAAADILVTITTQRWPLVLPSHEAIRTAPETLAVAWDRLAYVEGTISVPELLRAHKWATEQGLDWTDPVARAVAERVAVTGDTKAAEATKEVA